MKNLIKYLCIALTISSCSKTKEVKIAEPPKQLILNVLENIDGEIGGYCSAKNEKIKMIFQKDTNELLPGISFEVPIRLSFLKQEDIKAGYGYNHYGPTLEAEFLDRDGKTIEDLRCSMNTSMPDLARFIKSADREEWINFNGRFTMLNENSSLEESKKFIEDVSRASSVRIKSKIVAEEIDQHPGESSKETADRISGKSKYGGSSGDCDKFLDQYEEVVMEYVELLKKMKKDPQNTAYLADMTPLAEKIKYMDGDLNQCKNDAKVAKRLTEIQLKMADVK